MVLVKIASAILLFLACVAFAPLHHGWADYDQKTVLDFNGTVEEFEFSNPHATAKVKDKNKTWTVVLAPVSRMKERGVPNEKIVKGSSLRVVGYPHKKVKDEMRAERIFIDGKKYELR